MNPLLPPHSIQDLLDRLRPSMEPQKLAEFAEIRPGERVLEAGCGNGYISLFLAWRFPECGEIVSVDLNPNLIEQAKHTLSDLQAQCPSLPPVHFQEMDIRSFPAAETPFDVLLCNPPFFAPRSGKASPDPARRRARMEETLSLRDLFELATRVLSSEGRVYVVFPASRRMDLENASMENGYVVTHSQHCAQIRKRSGGIDLFCLEPRGTNAHP